MRVENKTLAIFLLLVLIAIGGIVMYGPKMPSKVIPENPPSIKGPIEPPPGYEALR